MLEVRGLRARVGSFELKGVDLEVRDGRYMVLMGPNGAGKTTLLNAIAGLIRPLEGRVVLNGRDITRLPPEERRIGYVFQEPMLFPHMTVYENVAFGLRARGLRGRELEERVRWALELVGIKHLAPRRPGQLSGGEAKEVALARALAIGPELLLLDEPLAHVDEASRARLAEKLKDLHDQLGLTAIHVTHDRLEALKLADDLAIMDSGRLVQAGDAREMLGKPASEFVARFLGFRNILRCRCRKLNGLYELEVGGLRILSVEGREGDAIMCLRAEDILVSVERPVTSARNVLEGRVLSIEPRGPVFELRVEVGSGVELVSVITPVSKEELGIRIGSKVYLAFKASSVKVI